MNTGVFGGNFLTGHLDNPTAARRFAQALNARMHLVMTDTPSDRPADAGFARDLKQDSPGTVVIFRPYNDRDSSWGDQSADQIWANHRQYAVDGLAVQVWNEPGYSPALIAKAALVAQYARQEGRTVALPTWAMGNPGEAAIASGGHDVLLRELAADRRPFAPERGIMPNLLAVHEYANNSTGAEPWHVTRFKQLRDRVHLRPEQVAILEYGRDLAGDRDKDGWDIFFAGSQQRYFDFLTPGAALYHAERALGAAIYCLGSTWPSFDIQAALTLQSLLVEWNRMNPTYNSSTSIPSPTTGGIRGRLTKIPGPPINVHRQPDTTAENVGDLHLDERVIYYPDSPHAGFLFVQLVDRTLAGWVSLQDGRVQFTPGDGTTSPISADLRTRLEMVQAHLASAAQVLSDILSPPAGVGGGGPDFQLDSPTVNGIVTQAFGVNLTGVRDFYSRWGLPAHEGIDFKASDGDLIYAAAPGEVEFIGMLGVNVAPDHPYGYHIKISHQRGGFATQYCHLSKIDAEVGVGGTVERGQVIGRAGHTGNVIHSPTFNGSHLHFMLRKAGATARGEPQHVEGGRWVIYPGDLVDPKPYFRPGTVIALR